MVRTDRHQLRQAAEDSDLAETVKVLTRTHKISLFLAHGSRPVPSYADDLLSHGGPLAVAAGLLWLWQIRRRRVATAAGFSRRGPGARALRAGAQVAVVLALLGGTVAYARAGTSTFMATIRFGCQTSAAPGDRCVIPTSVTPTSRTDRPGRGGCPLTAAGPGLTSRGRCCGGWRECHARSQVSLARASDFADERERYAEGSRLDQFRQRQKG